MKKYLLTSLSCGIVFAILDGLVNGNPVARKMLEVYNPILRPQFNIAGAVLVDFIYGFILAGLFLVLRNSIPGKSAIAKGLTYGFIIWIFRVLMNSISDFLLFSVPLNTTLYLIISGFVEMLIIGCIIGLFSTKRPESP